MSSFIINKVEYIKAAGLMYGIEDAKVHKHDYFLKHIRYYFCNCYALNVKSVNLQYGHNIAVDDGEYMDVFEEYKAKGRRIANCDGCGDVKNLGALRKRLTKFFECVLYQIEDEDCAEYASWLAFMCIMSKFEIYAAYDAIISLEASGDFRGACKKMKSINKSVSRRASKWQS